MRKLKVVHIQKAVLSTGRAPLRLHNAFEEENIESSILSMDFDVNLTDRVTEAGRKPRVISRVHGFLHSFITRKVKKKFGLFSFPILGSDISDNKLIQEADIIYIHWVQGGFLNLSGYRRIAKLGKPVVIFMHDMWTITGGCHHSFTCNKYKTKCFDCQMFPEKKLIDWPAIEFKRKLKLFKDFENLYFVSPSKWLFNCAKESFLTRDKPVFHIPNIVDNNLFKPVRKNTARQVLNLKENVTIVAFGAFSISSPYKGWPELLKALKILSEYGNFKDLTVLIFGGGYNKDIADSIPFKTRFMGFLKDEYSTVLVYNAIDVFVTPSLADNLPTTVLECQSCGTPVVGFDVGGIPDMIVHKKNGYLARYRDAEDLAEGIKFCLESKIRGKLLPEFEKTNILKTHFDLINSVKR